MYHHRSKDDNVSGGMADTVYRQVDKCLREITKKEHELFMLVDGEEVPVSYKSAKESIRVRVENRGRVSTGGYHGIKIDVYPFNFKRAFHVEYARIADDPVIGSTGVIGAELACFCVVAHEVAHHIQRKYAWMTRIYGNGDFKPHGQVWQDIYRILRSRVVNPLIDRELAIRELALAA